MPEDRLLCRHCGRDWPWSETWTAGGLMGPPVCPECNEPNTLQEVFEDD